MTEHEYSLERLYVDQHPDLVADSIPAVVAWLTARGSTQRSPVTFRVRLDRTGAGSEEVLLLDWDIDALEARSSGTVARIRRMRLRTGPEREHVTELAAYGLALVAISVWMPGRRAIAFNDYASPDILFDVTDGALRGV